MLGSALNRIGLIGLLASMPCQVFANDPSSECLPALSADLNNDGVVNYRDLWPVWRSYRLANDDFRFVKHADTNCDARVDDKDVDYVWQQYGQHYPVYVEAELLSWSIMENIFLGERNPILKVGKEGIIDSAIKFTSKPALVSQEPVQIKVSSRVTPDKGLRFKTNSQDQTFNEVILQREELFKLRYGDVLEKTMQWQVMPELPGDYHVDLRVAFLENRKMFHMTKTFTVLPVKNKPNLKLSLSYSQNWCANDESSLQSYLFLQAKVSGKDVADVESVLLINADSGETFNFLLNNSDNNMLGAFKEQYYLGQRVLISPEFIARQGCKKGYLKVTTADATLTSPQQTFCAKPKHSAKQQADAQFRCQQFIAISLKPGFSWADLKQRLASLDAQIGWYQAEIELYFVEPNAAASHKAWESLVGHLKGQDFIRNIKQYDQQTQSYIDQHFKL